MRWSKQDMKTLRRLYPTGGVAAVYEAIEGRHSPGSIKTTAWLWHIRCDAPLRDLLKARRQRVGR